MPQTNTPNTQTPQTCQHLRPPQRSKHPQANKQTPPNTHNHPQTPPFSCLWAPRCTSGPRCPLPSLAAAPGPAGERSGTGAEMSRNEQRWTEIKRDEQKYPDIPRYTQICPEIPRNTQIYPEIARTEASGAGQRRVEPWHQRSPLLSSHTGRGSGASATGRDRARRSFRLISAHFSPFQPIPELTGSFPPVRKRLSPAAQPRLGTGGESRGKSPGGKFQPEFFFSARTAIEGLDCFPRSSTTSGFGALFCEFSSARSNLFRVKWRFRRVKQENATWRV